MSELSSHIQQLNSIVAKHDGELFAKHIALPVGPSTQIAPAVKQFVDKIRRTNIVGLCENNCTDSNTCGIIAFRLMALVAVVDGDYEAGMSEILTAWCWGFPFTVSFSLQHTDTRVQLTIQH